MDANSLALGPGVRLEQFQIDSILGKGGFGITYLATDLQLGKKVAVKELFPDSIAARIEGTTVVPQSLKEKDNWEWARERFLEEARTLASFSHPAIVGVHHLIETNGTVYMVMDYVEGESYDAKLKRIGRESGDDSILSVMSPLIDGLEEVHATGLLHRDIKPENILLNWRGQPMLIDFGSARTTVGATMTMTTIVTHGYSPIEQYQTKGKMGPWTDIYALAAVMYRGITGKKPPMAADRVVEDEFKCLEHEVYHGFSSDFLEAVNWGLQLMPNQRPQSLGEWRERLLTQKSISSDPPSIKVAPIQQDAAALAGPQVAFQATYSTPKNPTANPSPPHPTPPPPPPPSVPPPPPPAQPEKPPGKPLGQRLSGVLSRCKKPFTRAATIILGTALCYGAYSGLKYWQYSEMRNASEMLMPVRDTKTDRLYFLSQSGRKLIPPLPDVYRDDLVSLGRFSRSKAPFQTSEGWGVMSNDGTVVERPSNLSPTVDNYQNGFSLFSEMEHSGVPGGRRFFRWGYKPEKRGDYHIFPIFEGAMPFVDFHNTVAKANGKWGVIDRRGKFVISPRYDDAWPTSEGFTPVKQGSLWGFIDKSGNMVIQPRFQDCIPFSSGLAAVKSNEKWGYIDTTGRMRIAPLYDSATAFRGRYAWVTSGEETFLITNDGKRLPYSRP